jgi:hypothetical protein
MTITRSVLFASLLATAAFGCRNRTDSTDMNHSASKPVETTDRAAPSASANDQAQPIEPGGSTGGAAGTPGTSPTGTTTPPAGTSAPGSTTPGTAEPTPGTTGSYGSAANPSTMGSAGSATVPEGTYGSAGGYGSAGPMGSANEGGAYPGLEGSANP